MLFAQELANYTCLRCLSVSDMFQRLHASTTDIVADNDIDYAAPAAAIDYVAAVKMTMAMTRLCSNFRRLFVG